MNAQPLFAPLSGPQRLLITAAGVVDAAGLSVAPGALLIEPGPEGVTVLASGSAGAVADHPGAAGARAIALPEDVLFPALANAHAHLDLTHLGPVPFDPSRSFADWAQIVIRGRARDEHALRESVRDGIARSIRGGVVAVGDIAGVGRSEPHDELRASPLLGVSHIECFGFGETGSANAAGANALRERYRTADHDPNPRVRIGFSPHAPYSAGLALYEALAPLVGAAGPPLCTHLAESPEEHEFVAHARGPMRDLAERLGVWSDAAAHDVGRGAHPVAHLAPLLARTPMLLAHVNDCPDGALETIAASGSSVVWCPRGHEYFGREATLGPHRWKDMLRAGVNVAIATDSIINLPPDEADRLSPLDDARHLWRRGERDWELLLRCITTNGAKALGLDPSRFTLGPGPVAGLAALRTGRLGPTDAPGAALMAAPSAYRPRLLAFAGGFDAELRAP